MQKKCISLFSILLFLLFPMTANAQEIESSKNTKIEVETFLEYATEIGEIYNIDPYFLLAIAERESSLRPNVTNKNGTCFGLMQVSEKWHKDRMERLGVEDLFDPYGNILVAADYLFELSETNSDPHYILMRYNMKKDTANKLYKEGKISKYAQGIVQRAEQLREEYEQKYSEQTQEDTGANIADTNFVDENMDLSLYFNSILTK